MHGFKVTSIETFLGLDQWALPDGIIKTARLLAALYSARNAVIHQPTNSPEEVLRLACLLVGAKEEQAALIGLPKKGPIS